MSDGSRQSALGCVGEEGPARDRVAPGAGGNQGWFGQYSVVAVSCECRLGILG